jgi:ketosteroid isomerase-like protein
MRGRLIALGFCLSIGWLGGCATTQVHALRDELLATDHAWAEAAAGRDVERIASYWTDDAVVYLAGRPPVVGKEALIRMVQKGRATEGFCIHWDTFDAVVARSGDLAYTLAHYTMTAPRPDGALVTQRGTSICAWRREDGTWRCTLEVHAPGERQRTDRRR